MQFSVRSLPSDEVAENGIEWEETDCLLCGGSQSTPIVEAPDHAGGADGRWFMVVQCRDCGLCFTNPRPSPASMPQFYRSFYEPHQPREFRHGRAAWRWFGRARRHALAWHGEGRLLDFGPAISSFPIHMQRQGWNVVALDASPLVVAQLRERHHIKSLVGTLPCPELAGESFDVITMWQALEHVHEPSAVLRDVHRLLAPGGKLVITTPNIDSLAFRWFGPAWHGLDLPRHLIHFAPWTLRLLLYRAGFRKMHLSQQRRSGWLRASARHACRLRPHTSAWRHLLQTKPASTVATWYANLTGQADCLYAVAVKQ